MTGNKILIILFLDFAILYTGCSFDNFVLEVVGSVCLLALAVATVFPTGNKSRKEK